MTRVLQNFDANLKRLCGMVLASPSTSQTHGLALDFRAWSPLWDNR